MSDDIFEAVLCLARPSKEGYSPFTDTVMRQIKTKRILDKHAAHEQTSQKHGLLQRLRALHGLGLVVAIATALLVLGGVVYASVYFAPDLIKAVNQGVNNQGKIEYNAPAFTNCYKDGRPKLDKFEIVPGTQLSDTDVQKTLQAKCEMLGMNDFANKMWPTYGEHKNWQDGDTIYYTRPDMMGTVKSIGDTSLVMSYGSTNPYTDKPSYQTYKSFDGKKIEAFSHGKKVGLDSIKPGDYVFSIVRASEVHHTKPNPNGGDIQQPQQLGLIAVVKLSQPPKYYNAMQDNVIEVRPCEGNPQERCSDGPIGSSIDVFPREDNKESTANPYTPKDRGDVVWREIGGTIQSIQDGRFTVKAPTTGATYTINARRSQVIDRYNSEFAPAYDTHEPADKVRVKVGSWVSIIYYQAPNDDPKHIAIGDIMRMSLVTDIGVKKSLK
jgi:hypothetical protein